MANPSGDNPVPHVLPGDLLAGKYRVERILGVGGMGLVVAARHEELGRRVALKILRPEIAGSEEVLPRFLQEARAAARIESDHIARVFDVGTLESGHAFMVMEHLDGTDLEAILVSQGPLGVSCAVDDVLEALEAVAHAHALGMVHRDLKPSNLFLEMRPDGTQRIKVLDFGISKSSSGLDAPSASLTLTSPQAIMGSPAYMSPEQVRSTKNVDARSDIWSIGIILFELLTGTRPFEGESVGEVFARILELDPPSLCAARPSVPAGLGAVCKRCLARDRAQRFSSVAELAAALAPFGSARTAGLPARIALILRVTVGDRLLLPSSAEGASRMDAAVVDGDAADRGAPSASRSRAAIQQTGAVWAGETRVGRPSRRALIAIGGAAVACLVIAIGVASRSGASSSAAPPAPVRAAIEAPPRAAETLPAAPPIAQATTSESAATAASAVPPGSALPPGPASAVRKTVAKTVGPAGATKPKPLYPAKLFDGRD